METRESIISDSSQSPSLQEHHRISEELYWKEYYQHPEGQYEWNNGFLEEKPMPDFLSISLYQWFFRLLEEYLTVFPRGRIMALEMGFRLDLGDKVSVRKPDLAVLLHSNPVVPHPTDRSFHGVCDLCIEFLSDSTPSEVERDTVFKKEEYAKAGVAEYYILDRLGKHTCFYRLHEAGTYQRLDSAEEGLIQSTVLEHFAFRRQDLEAQTSFKTLMNDPLYQPYLLKSLQEERQQREQERQLKEQERQQKEQALKREELERQQKEQERQQKEQALKREELERQQKEQALEEIKHLRALLQNKHTDLQ